MINDAKNAAQVFKRLAIALRNVNKQSITPDELDVMAVTIIKRVYEQQAKEKTNQGS